VSVYDGARVLTAVSDMFYNSYLVRNDAAAFVTYDTVESTSAKVCAARMSSSQHSPTLPPPRCDAPSASAWAGLLLGKFLSTGHRQEARIR
jgi:hypothetical protein